MSEPARTLDPAPPPQSYPDDLSDLSPRLLVAYQRQGITADELRAFRRNASPEDFAEMRAYEASLARMGLTVEDVDDPAPLTAAERAEFLRDAAEWATPAQLEALRRDLDAA